MKKYLFCLHVLTICFLNLNAQKNSNYIKIHAGAEITTGLFAEGYNSGWGVYITDYYGISDGGSIAFSTGVAVWKSSDASEVKAGMSLTRLGFRQFVAEGFYLQADAGIGIGLQSFSGATRFAFGGGPGYLFKSKKGGGLDISTRINRGFNRTWIGVGAGYQFKL